MLNGFSQSISFEELCLRNNDCQNANREVHSRIIEIIRDNREFILSHSQAIGIDPRALAGAMMAENTLNIDILDRIQFFLAYGRLTQVGSREFSFGFAQMTIAAATDVEAILSISEGRSPRTHREMREYILTREGSLYYAGGVLMMAQEAYARHGMDISQNLGALTSLYTRGSFDYLASQRVQQGGSPQINTFGYFVEKNLPLVEEILFN